jgi:hypothetical protein
MRLPQDPRVFAPHVLPLIEAGKFERGLARRMPAVLARDARVLEIGSAVGFLAGHCANVRPDLTLVMQEDDPGLRQMMTRVLVLSDRGFDDRFRLSAARLRDPAADLPALLRSERPDAMLLADARLSPELLAGLLADPTLPLAAQVFVYGRLIERWHARIAEVATLLEARGYAALDGFDPNVCRGFELGSGG